MDEDGHIGTIDSYHFYATFCDLDLGGGPQAQCKTQPAGLFSCTVLN